VVVPHARSAPLQRDGHVTFGSFNQVAKLSPTTRRMWARILERAPEARLLIVGVARGRAEETLRADFATAGIAAGRIEFAPFVPVEEYLRLYDRVDLALDPTPYSGGTTTCDALWMGVPVLTLPGSRPASRSASSVLSTLGLADWIAADADDYVRRALNFAARPELLGSLRNSLRARMQASPLMDEAAFTHDLERAYREMWQHSGVGETPQGR
jgi:predicted O-linked N-acetylglucosamine transferase (SPINDLY family)